MNLPDTIHLELKAKHFRDTNFINCGDCAISKAIIEKMNWHKVIEFIAVLFVPYGDREIEYAHDPYQEVMFNADKKAASALPDESVVRVITLNKIK